MSPFLLDCSFQLHHDVGHIFCFYFFCMGNALCSSCILKLPSPNDNELFAAKHCKSEFLIRPSLYQWGVLHQNIFNPNHNSRKLLRAISWITSAVIQPVTYSIKSILTPSTITIISFKNSTHTTTVTITTISLESLSD